MKDVDLYLKVRHAVRIEGLSERAAARRFGIDPRTVNKMMKFSVPPGYVRKKPPAKPKLDPFISVIDRILEDDKSRPKKQQHTAKRIFERLRDEHGFTGGVTIVKDGVVPAGLAACVVAGGGFAGAGSGITAAFAGDRWRDRDRVCGWGSDADHRGGRSLHRVGADEGAREGQAAAMIPVPSGARVWLAAGHTNQFLFRRLVLRGN